MSTRTESPSRGMVILGIVGAILGVGLFLVTAANYLFGLNVLPPSLLVIGIVLAAGGGATVRRYRR